MKLHFSNYTCEIFFSFKRVREVLSLYYSEFSINSFSISMYSYEKGRLDFLII